MKLFLAKALLKAAWCVCFPLRGPIFVLQETWYHTLLWAIERRPDSTLEQKFHVQNASPRVSPWVRPMVVHTGTWKWWLLSRVSAWCSNIEHKPERIAQIQELRKAVADLATKVNELKEKP